MYLVMISNGSGAPTHLRTHDNVIALSKLVCQLCVVDSQKEYVL